MSFVHEYQKSSTASFFEVLAVISAYSSSVQRYFMVLSISSGVVTFGWSLPKHGIANPLWFTESAVVK